MRLGVLEERNHVAREIHDTLAQGLAATGLQLEAADALLEAGEDDYRLREKVRLALFFSRTNLEKARNSALDLPTATGYS